MSCQLKLLERFRSSISLYFYFKLTVINEDLLKVGLLPLCLYKYLICSNSKLQKANMKLISRGSRQSNNYKMGSKPRLRKLCFPDFRPSHPVLCICLLLHSSAQQCFISFVRNKYSRDQTNKLPLVKLLSS